jgi:hypothetical protein
MLFQQFDTKAVVDERAHRLAKAVVPLILACIGYPSRRTRIGGTVILLQRFGLLEIGVFDLGPVIGQGPGERMYIVEVKSAGRGHKSAHLCCPTVHVR